MSMCVLGLCVVHVRALGPNRVAVAGAWARSLLIRAHLAPRCHRGRLAVVKGEGSWFIATKVSGKQNILEYFLKGGWRIDLNTRLEKYGWERFTRQEDSSPTHVS